jgi:hypothetical protein
MSPDPCNRNAIVDSNFYLARLMESSNIDPVHPSRIGRLQT